MAAPLAVDQPKGKGKGKGKKPKPTPQEMGFQDVGRRILTREAKLLHAVPVAEGLEISSLEIGKKGKPAPLDVTRPRASVEVLCNRQSLFGNPFNMREDESIRDDICDAYVEYIDEVLISASLAQGSSAATVLAKTQAEERSLRSVVDRIAGNRRLPATSLSKDWLRDFGLVDIATFQASFEALVQFCLQQRSVGGTSFVCHCIPRRCHCMTLAARVQAAFSSQAEPQPQAKAAGHGVKNPHEPTATRRRSSRGICAGVIALRLNCADPLVCIVEKANGKLGFPKGGAEAQDASVLATALREWREETNFPSDVLHGLSEDVQVVDSWGVKYFPAMCVIDNEAEPGVPVRWLVQDQADDPDPIVWAQWMPCSEALKHPMLSRERKLVLQQAMVLLRKPPQPQSPTPGKSETEGASLAQQGIGEQAMVNLLLSTCAFLAVLAQGQWVDPCEEAGGDTAVVDHTHAKLGQVLAAHISRGTKSGITANLVDYAKLKGDPSVLREYMQTLCNVDLTALDDAHKMALLINAYNAAMMAMVVAYDIQVQVWDVSNIFSIKFATVGGTKMSLDDIEHGMIREASGVGNCNDASLSARMGASGRIHAAVNCASMSCPDLHTVPFLPGTIQEQLTEVAENWMMDSARNPGLENGQLKLSMIFNWYGCDMEIESGSTQQAWVASMTGWTVPPSATIVHEAYNWNLNAATNVATDSGLESNVAAPNNPAQLLLALASLLVCMRLA